MRECPEDRRTGCSGPGRASAIAVAYASCEMIRVKDADLALREDSVNVKCVFS